MPPSLVDWLPENHLVWTVLGAVEQMDLERFEAAYRLGAAGRAPYDPAMLVALLVYAYARGNRSSRGIERSCWEDVAFKVITGMRTPDHSTIAEFRRRHETEIEELFDDVLGLCREAGLVSVGVIAIDGTRIKANASMDQNRSYREVVNQILREAEETDRREDELYGDARGDELPEQLRTPEGRRAALEEAKRRIEERKGRAVDEEETVAEEVVDPEFDTALDRPPLREVLLLVDRTTLRSSSAASPRRSTRFSGAQLLRQLITTRVAVEPRRSVCSASRRIWFTTSR